MPVKNASHGPSFYTLIEIGSLRVELAYAHLVSNIRA